MTRKNRLTRLTRMNRRPILENDKMVKPVGAQENGKTLKPTGPKIDARGKMIKLTSDKMVKSVKW